MKGAEPAVACVLIAAALAGCARPSGETRNAQTIVGCVSETSVGYLVSFEATCNAGHGVRGNTSDAGALRRATTIAAATLECARKATCTPPIAHQIARNLDPARFTLFTTAPEGTHFVFRGDAGELVELFVDARGNVSTGSSYPETTSNK